MATRTATTKTTATKLVDLATSNSVIFHSPDGQGFARISENGINRIERIGSMNFRSWLGKLYWLQNGSGAGKNAIEDALNVLRGMAIYAGSEIPVHIRIAKNGENLYVDLGDPDWTSVEITPQGWSLTGNPPVAFWRPRGLGALPFPESGGALNGLFDLLNIDETQKATRRLILSWILGAYHPTGPFPVLALYGEQGSSKSFTSRVIRALVDPNVSPLRAVPKDLHDLAIMAVNSRVIAMDNVSDIPDWLSDGLCRVATGAGFSTRELYSDDGEIALEAVRPVMLNGITEVIYRPDLLERTIILELPSIPDDKRKSERDLLREFEAVSRGALGFIYDALSGALANLENVKLDRLPRMADFAEWITAAEPSLGLQTGELVKTFRDNQKNAEAFLLGEDALAAAIHTLLSSNNPWSGTASELLTTMKSPTIMYFDSPNPRSLSTRLRRLVPSLRRSGISVSFSGTSPRTIKLETMQVAP